MRAFTEKNIILQKLFRMIKSTWIHYLNAHFCKIRIREPIKTLAQTVKQKLS